MFDEEILGNSKLGFRDRWMDRRTDNAIPFYFGKGDTKSILQYLKAFYVSYYVSYRKNAYEVIHLKTAKFVQRFPLTGQTSIVPWLFLHTPDDL